MALRVGLACMQEALPEEGNLRVDRFSVKAHPVGMLSTLKASVYGFKGGTEQEFLRSRTQVRVCPAECLGSSSGSSRKRARAS